ncbi:MAG: ParB N-terminal domain-containing protein [Bacteroidales bacterium]|nr:ParB N-terminal domain-containing protein [Bacteroidales bacterium]
MDTAVVKIADIHPAAYNPRKTLQPGDKEWESLKDSLDRFGVAEPLIVNRRTGNLVSGHQRLNVLKTSGAEEVEVVLVDLDPDQEKLCNVALNKIDGDWDYMKLQALFEEIPDDDIKYTGFSAEEVKNLFAMDADLSDLNGDSGGEENGRDGAAEETQGAEGSKTFTVFLSFPTRELADSWLKARGISEDYPEAVRNFTVRMEGSWYGT